MEAEGSEKLLPLRPWVGVTIGGRRLLAKSCFTHTAYGVLLSDLHGVWEELMDCTAIHTRAQALNRRLQAPGPALLAHLCSVVQPVLSGGRTGSSSQVHLLQEELTGGGVMLTLRSELAGLPFYWEFHCSPAPVSLVCAQLVRPLVSMVSLLRQHVEQLKGVISQKDCEIMDYREGGGTLSRERLRTDIFDEQTNTNDFLSKVMSSLCDDHANASAFDADLQHLYALVVSHPNPRKRKLSDQSCDANTANIANAPEETPTVADETVNAVAKETIAVEEDTVAAVSGAGPVCREEVDTRKQDDTTTLMQQRSQSFKGKKKKVGLFR